MTTGPGNGAASDSESGSGVGLQALDAALNAATRAAIGRAMQKAVQPVLEALLRPITDELRRVSTEALGSRFEGFADLVAHAGPPNWRDVTGFRLFPLEEVVANEVIPLAFVPRGAFVQAVVDAPSPEGRRSVFTANWREITQDCRAVLSGISQEGLVQYRDFAVLAAEALEVGHPEASQTLSMNTIDSLILHELADEYTRAHFRYERKVKPLPDRTSRSVLGWVVMEGTFGLHRSFSPKDPVPTVPNRHATAHAVSVEQVNLTNSVMALCHLTGLLALFDSGQLDEKDEA